MWSTVQSMRLILVALIVVLTAAPAFAEHEPRRSRYFFGIGFMVRKSPSEIGNLGGLRGTPYVPRTVETPRTPFDHDIGFRWRAGLDLGPPLFVALDVGMGMTVMPDGVQDSAPMRTASSATALGVAGVRGETISTTLGVELAAGFRHVTYCIGESVEEHVAYTDWRPVAELRARGERRLGASARLGVTVGTSLIDRGGWVGLLDVTFSPVRARAR